MTWLWELLRLPSWEWFSTPSGSEPPSDNPLVKFIRRCQAPLIAHPLGALASLGAVAGTILTPTWFGVPFGAGVICFYWQLTNWEANNSITYPPREILWRMVLSLFVLVPVSLLWRALS